MKTIRTMHASKFLGLLALGAALTLPVAAQAQPETNAPKGQNPPNRTRRARGQKGQRGQRNAEKQLARTQERELAAAEVIAGKPLTDEQKQKVSDAVKAREEVTRAAREKYVTDLAASLGLDPDAVRLKMRDAMRAGARGAAGAGGGRRNRANAAGVAGAPGA
jgi:hypothetical protein